MYTFSRILLRLGLFASILIGFLYLPPTLNSQNCDRRAVLRGMTTVYENVPRFSTGQGWILSKPVATLSKGTTVRICREEAVGFAFSEKKWAQIRFSQNGPDMFGWISAELLQASILISPNALISIGGIAYAQDQIETTAGLPDSSPVYILMFIAVCIGMIAKGLFDWLEHNVQFRNYIFKTIRSLLVSPIVFLGIATAGDFQIHSTQSLLVFLCLAFQNGFFWQTVLVKVEGNAPKP